MYAQGAVISFTNVTGNFATYYDNANTLVQELSGTHVKVMVMASGLSIGSGLLSAEAIDDLGREIATSMAANPQFAGIMLDVELNVNVSYFLCSRIKWETYICSLNQ